MRPTSRARWRRLAIVSGQGVLDGRLTHDGDPTLARHVANCVVRESSSGTVITKPDPSGKIDAAVAAVVAFERAIWHAQPLDVPFVEVIRG